MNRNHILGIIALLSATPAVVGASTKTPYYDVPGVGMYRP